MLHFTQTHTLEIKFCTGLSIISEVDHSAGPALMYNKRHTKDIFIGKLVCDLEVNVI